MIPSQPTNTILVALSLWAALAAQTCGQTPLAPPDSEAAKLSAVLRSETSEFEKAKACQRLAVIGGQQAVPALAGLLGDQHLSNYARYALEAIPDPAAGAALREAVGHVSGPLRIGILSSIGRRRDPADVNVLRPLLGDPDLAVATAAAKALGYLGTVRAANVLRQALASSSPQQRVAVANACLICGDQLLKQGQLDKALALNRAVRTADVATHLIRAATLQAITMGSGQSLQVLAEQLNSDDDAQFQLGLHAIRLLDNDVADDVSQLLTEQFAQRSPARQAQILMALRDLGSGKSLATVLQAVTQGTPQVRVAAIQVLATQADASAVPPLLEAALAADATVSRAATETLVELPNDEVDPTIVRLLGSEDARRRQLAIRLAGRRGLAAATPTLFQLADDADPTIRQSAIQALGFTVRTANFPQLIARLATRTQEDQTAVHEAIRTACARVPDRSAYAEHLTRAVASASPEDQRLLVEALATVGGPRALETVVAAAGSDDAALQDVATRVLGNWMSPDVGPELFALAKNLSNNKYQARALRGYLRVARQLSSSSGQTLDICRNAFEISEREEERRLVLELLRQTATPAATALAKTLTAELEAGAGFESLFDGNTLTGWEGNLDIFRVQEGAIVGGRLTEPIARNEFLCTKKEYRDFELRLQFKLLGSQSNAGVQIRSQRIPDHHEVRGYQADLGNGWWGCLYDESRRRKVLAGPAAAERDQPVYFNQWNDYRIRCQGKRIQLWLNGTPTVDYTEQEPDIERHGILGIQIHSGPPSEAWYRNIRIQEL